MLNFFLGNEEREEPADPVAALKEQLDAHGEFKKDADGTLSLDDFLVH